LGKDLHNDNFEDFIKKNLESFDDEPSDAMWERIAPIIPTKPGVNWQGFIMPTSLVVSVVLLVFLGWKIQQYKSTSQSLTKALERSNEQIEQLKNFSTNENLDSILNVAENFNSTENTTENFN
jgi:sensor c-di-GMP phosphodiesterase-like protein